MYVPGRAHLVCRIFSYSSALVDELNGNLMGEDGGRLCVLYRAGKTRILSDADRFTGRESDVNAQTVHSTPVGYFKTVLVVFQRIP